MTFYKLYSCLNGHEEVSLRILFNKIGIQIVSFYLESCQNIRKINIKKAMFLEISESKAQPLEVHFNKLMHTEKYLLIEGSLRSYILYSMFIWL